MSLRCSWKELRQVCEKLGWTEDRIKGDHLSMVKEGMLRPVVIKMDKDLGDDLLSSCCRTLGIKRRELDGRLMEIRGQRKALRQAEPRGRR